MTKPRIKVGISSCLLGQEVRYDGGHKRSALCAQELGQLFEFVPTCPEAGAGLGVPRPAVQLRGDPAAPRAVGVLDSSLDVTDRLQAYADQRLAALGDLCGYVFIRNSPSCGLMRVKLYDAAGSLRDETSRGIFAEAFTRAYPQLPVEEEGRLQDPVLRENFITRVFALHNWRQLQQKGVSAAGLTDFHARYKYTVMAHSPRHYQELGRMLADAGKQQPVALGERYFAGLMEALQQRATRGTNTNVLMHLQGYLKTQLQDEEKQALTVLIEQYRKGLVPLAGPVQALREHFTRHPDPYIARQTYLQSYTDSARQELAL
jgi:uncharacterized protein YbgA (DUF1722 family)/uncharacterized protein YbbK (DUF523 family)